MIDRATVEKIMDATNIVDVVSEFVSLKKVGANYKGLCPFHDDKTPSFYVSPARGICHCFSCGKGGNAVNFIMEHEQMTYPESLRWLAHKYNIEIQERELSNEEKERENERESMFIMNDWTNQYFQNLLHNDEYGQAIGMQYFRQRGFRDDIIAKFQLGYDLADRRKLAATALAAGYKEEYLLKNGICYKNDREELIDRFAGRVVFPWIAMSGKVVGFTARVLDSRTKGVNQKYVNSPDSEIFHKGNELYGIYQAKKTIAKENHVYLVEGQADVISMHQCGIENVVAGSGTALTDRQIHILHRFTQNITLIYDDDEAGHHAALVGTDKLLMEGMNLKILLLPNGMDPDEFARSHSAEEFKQYIQEHETDFIEFKSEVLLRGVRDPIKRSEAINSIVRSVSMISDQIVRATYIKDCSQKFGLPEHTLISQMNQMIRAGKAEQLKAAEREERQQEYAAQQAAQVAAMEAAEAAEHGEPLPQQAQQPAAPVVNISPQDEQLERHIIQLVVRYGEQCITVRDVDDNEVKLPLAQYVALDLGADNLQFHIPVCNQILNEAVEHLSEEGFRCEPYFTQHHELAVSQFATQLCIDRYQLSERLKVDFTPEKLRTTIFNLILSFRKSFVEHRIADIRVEIANMKSLDDMKSLLEENQKLLIIRNRIAKELGQEIIV